MRNFNKLVLSAALAAMPLLTACGNNNQTPQEQARTVEVQLSDSHIQMPATVPAGKTTFQVVNNDTAPHDLQIEGPAGQKEVTVEPGKSASVDMILDPGTYRVHSPENQQMVMALNVTQG